MAFHINGKGEPGKCSATKGNCPFGGEHQHYPTAEVAQKAYELSMAAQVVAEPVRANPVLSPTGTTASSVKGVPDGKLIAGYAMANKRANELHERLRNSYSSLTVDERKNLIVERDRARHDAKLTLTEIEDRGLGHTVPDQGPTLRVANRAQKVLFEEELSGQISDGHWENLEQKDWQNGGRGHWEIWSEAQVIVDPKNLGRNFRAGKDNYQLNAKALLDVVGDRMVQSVQDAGDAQYNEARMAADLRDLRKIFKTQRGEHRGGPVEPQPTPPSAPPAAAAKASPLKNRADHTDRSLISQALQGEGKGQPHTFMYGVHSGMANPTAQDDPYDHMKSGGTVILAKADGSRARACAGGAELFGEPESRLGQASTLFKQRSSGPDAATDGLYVVGYVDGKGNKYGWVPDRKIQFFVLK